MTTVMQNHLIVIQALYSALAGDLGMFPYRRYFHLIDALDTNRGQKASDGAGLSPK